MPGESVVITVNIASNCTDTVTALGLRESIPAGWSLESVQGTNPPDFASAAGTETTLDFGWFNIPDFPASFTYTLSVPDTQTVAGRISGMVLYRLDGGEISGTEVQTTVCLNTGMGGEGEAPVITLLGDAEVSLECGQVYVDEGATAFDDIDGDITASIAVNGLVDNNTTGTYTITYDVIDSNANQATQVARTVTVGDTTPPVVTLVGSATLAHDCGSPYTEFGATATDGCSGNLVPVVTGTVNVVVPGDYILTYRATDEAGLSAFTTRTVTVADMSGPAITILGDNPMTVECGAVFADPGATALDACDGLTAEVRIISNTVNTDVPGTYTIGYSAVDSGNRSSGSTREVIVVDATPPALTLVGGSTLTIGCGAPFNDPGAVAMDNCDPDIALPTSNGASVVNTSRAGTYTVTYRSTDGAGNVGSITRNVVVQGEGCSEATVPVCSPLDFEVTQPANNTIFVSDGAPVTPILFAARVPFPESEECKAGTPQVAYTVNGTTQSSESEDTGFSATYFLSPGEHVVVAEAEVQETGEILTQEFTLTIIAIDDSDANGFIDQPFNSLEADGSSWTARTARNGVDGQVAMTAWDGACDAMDEGVVELRLRNPEDRTQLLTVSVDRALLACNERGILTIALGPQINTILPSSEANQLPALPDGALSNGVFFDISIIVSSDGGETYAPIATSQLVARPVRFSVSGLAIPANSTPRFMHYPTTVVATGNFGLSAGSGAWTETAIQNVRAEGSTLHGEAVSLSLFAPFAETESGNGPGTETPPDKEGGTSCAPGQGTGSAYGTDVAVLLAVLLSLVVWNRRAGVVR